MTPLLRGRLVFSMTPCSDVAPLLSARRSSPRRTLKPPVVRNKRNHREGLAVVARARSRHKQYCAAAVALVAAEVACDLSSLRKSMSSIRTGLMFDRELQPNTCVRKNGSSFWMSHNSQRTHVSKEARPNDYHAGTKSPPCSRLIVFFDDLQFICCHKKTRKEEHGRKNDALQKTEVKTLSHFFFRPRPNRASWTLNM